MQEFREHFKDLATQDGISLAKACNLAGLTSTLSMTTALTKYEGRSTSGLSTLTRILEAIGFELEPCVIVRKIAYADKGRITSLDPEMIERVTLREALKDKELEWRYGKHKKKAAETLLTP